MTVNTNGEREGLRRELAALLNRHSRERHSNTPDGVLAEYLLRCLDSFDHATRVRDRWYGLQVSPTEVRVLPVCGSCQVRHSPDQECEPTPEQRSTYDQLAKAGAVTIAPVLPWCSECGLRHVAGLHKNVD